VEEAAYRETPARCPVCAVAMELRDAGESVVDVCPTCRGLWLDWLDGDTRSVTELAMPLSLRADPPITTSPRCPRCEVALTRQSSTPGRPGLWRCGQCAGTFLPRSMVDTVLAWDAEYEDEPLKKEDPSSPLARLLRALRALFGEAGPEATRAE
jgi:Zn-finger nucleic acid-binding protein